MTMDVWLACNPPRFDQVSAFDASPPNSWHQHSTRACRRLAWTKIPTRSC